MAENDFITASCPQCGRTLNIPRGREQQGIGCKNCRNIFTYDAKTGALSPYASSPARQSFRPGDKLAAGLAIFVLILAILGGGAYYVAAYTSISPTLSRLLTQVRLAMGVEVDEKAPAENPADTVARIRKNLKDIAE